LTGVYGQQTRDAVQGRGFPAPRRSQQGDELTAADGQIDPAKRVERAEAAAYADQLQLFET
jgi:hypothetical protein